MRRPAEEDSEWQPSSDEDSQDEGDEAGEQGSDSASVEDVGQQRDAISRGQHTVETRGAGPSRKRKVIRCDSDSDEPAQSAKAPSRPSSRRSSRLIAAQHEHESDDDGGRSSCSKRIGR